MIHRTGTASALASSFGLFLGLYAAALATMAGSPLAALAAALVGLGCLLSLLTAPSVQITEAPEPAMVPAVVFRGAAHPARAATPSDVARYLRAKRAGVTFWAPVTGRGGAWFPAAVAGLAGQQ